jgi:hypothetical protein
MPCHLTQQSLGLRRIEINDAAQMLTNAGLGSGEDAFTIPGSDDVRSATGPF